MKPTSVYMNACAPYIQGTAGSERVKCAYKNTRRKPDSNCVTSACRSKNVFVLRTSFAPTHMRCFYCRWMYYQPTASSCRSIRVPWDHNHCIAGPIVRRMLLRQRRSVLRKPSFRKTLKMNNNAVCAEICQEKGFALAATQGTSCYCENTLPAPRLYEAAWR